MNDVSSKQTVTIKKYANRRLYNTASSSYVTLENLSAMVKEGIDFCVYDAKSGEDITRAVLTQIIVEEEGKSGQQNLLPISFLRQLISFYGDNMQWMVPKYLEQSMELFSNNQEQIRGYFENTFGTVFPFGSTLEEMSKQNIAMFERTMRLFAPFGSEANQEQGNAADATQNPLNMMAFMTRMAGLAADAQKAASANVACACASGSEGDKGACCCKDDKASDESCACAKDTDDAGVKMSVDEGCCCCSAPAATSELDSELPTMSATKLSQEEAPSEAPGSNVSDLKSHETSIPMTNVQNATSNSTSTDDMQQKIANLQRQLAELAKNRA